MPEDPKNFNPDNAEAFDPNNAEPVTGQTGELEKIQGIFNDPANTLRMGITKIIDGGSPISGLVDVIHGILKVPGGVIGAGIEAARTGESALSSNTGGDGSSPVTDTIANIASVPGQVGEAVIGKAEDIVGGVIKAFGLTGEDARKFASHIYGLQGKQYDETLKSLSELNSTLSQYAGYAFAGGVAKGIKAGAIGDLVGDVSRKVIPETLPEKLSTKSLSAPTIPNKTDEAFQRPAKTAIKEDIQTSNSGLEKLGGLINQIDDAYKSGINTLGNQGKVVDYQTTLDHLNEIKSQYKGSMIEKEANSMLKEANDRISNRLKQFPDGNVPADIAYTDYTQLRDIARGKFDEVGSMKEELYKNTANTIIRQIQNFDPSLKALGTGERDFIELEKVLTSKVRSLAKSKISNDLLWKIGLRSGVAGSVGAMLGGTTEGATLGAMSALTEMALHDSKVQHTLAVMADKARKLGLDPRVGNPQLSPYKFANAIAKGWEDNLNSEWRMDGKQSSNGSGSPVLPNNQPILPFGGGTKALPDATKQLPASHNIEHPGNVVEVSQIRPELRKYAVLDKNGLVDDRLAYYTNWKKMNKVAPIDAETPYRPASLLSDGTVVWDKDAVHHADAVLKWMQKNNINPDKFDYKRIVSSGGIAPDGYYYDQGIKGDVKKQDINYEREH